MDNNLIWLAFAGSVALCMVGGALLAWALLSVGAPPWVVYACGAALGYWWGSKTVRYLLAQLDDAA